MSPWLIVTVSPARLAPLARVWYAADGFVAVRAALSAFPGEVLFEPARPSPVAGLPC